MTAQPNWKGGASRRLQHSNDVERGAGRGARSCRNVRNVLHNDLMVSHHLVMTLITDGSQL